jgi:hypothetical protein
MAKLITLTNNYHHTETRVLSGELSRATARRVRRTLCGSRECTCGGVLGQRGSQMQPDGRSDAIIEDESDGRVWVLYVNRDGNRQA